MGFVISHKNIFNKLLPIKLLSYRGQAKQRPGKFSVVSCSEDQTRGIAILRIERKGDVLTGVICADKNESLEIMFKRKLIIQ